MTAALLRLADVLVLARGNRLDEARGTLERDWQQLESLHHRDR